MKLSLNREYAARHLFVAALAAGLSCWFAYDGFVEYPATPAADLYRSIEKSDPQPGTDLDAFKLQKTQTQKSFAAVSLAAALVIALRLLKSAAFRFEYDENGFVCGGRRRPYSDIVSKDLGRWGKKGIVSFTTKDGVRTVLDAWHHSGVKEFAAAHLGAS